MGAGFAVTLTAAFTFYGMNKPRAAIYFGAACWIFFGVGLAALLLKRVGEQRTEARDDQFARLASQLAEQKELELRPYIDISNPILEPLVVGQLPMVRVTIRNTGRTPAVDVIVGSRVQVGDFPLFTDTRYFAIDGPRVTLGAGQSATTDIPADHALTKQELEGLNSGMKWLKAHGEIVFSADPPPKTPFKHPHFCFVLTKVGNQMEVCDNFGDHSDQGVFR
jgi:hypothetical protein